MTTRKLPKKVWFHAHKGEVWFADVFFSRKSARKSLKRRVTVDKHGHEVTLKKAGWAIVGPYVR